MSHTQYFVSQLIGLVKEIVDRAGIEMSNPTVYRAFLTGVNTQGSALQNGLFAHLDQQTNGGWRQGIHQQTLVDILRPWINQALTWTDTAIRQQQPTFQQPAYGGGGGWQATPQQGVMPQSTPQYALSAPSNQPQQQIAQGPSQGVMLGTAAPQQQIINTRSSGYDLGGDIVFSLRKVPAVDIPKVAAGGALEISNYSTGEYEKERLVTVEINLRVAQNTVEDVGKLVYDLAPQEVVRGLFANVVQYHELFHLPISYRQFCALAADVGQAYYNREKTDWRTAIEALSSRARAEWRVMNDALCKLINDAIYRRLRTTPGAIIEGIESLDDLATLDDRALRLTVARHANYWTTFNNLATLSVEKMFDPNALVKPTDANFGDFVHCDAVHYYADGRSKYDYGTFQEKVDKDQFIDHLLATSTVIRIPRTIILTNALDPRLVADTKLRNDPRGILLNSISTVGTTLINMLDFPKRGTIEGVVCLEQGGSPDRYCERINLGRTLDGDLTLLR